MDRRKNRHILFHIFEGIAMLLALLFLLFLFGFLPLLEHGLAKPLGSLTAQKEIRTYLDKFYPEEALRITFPRYDFIAETFGGRIRDMEGTWLFGVEYNPDTGSFTEWELSQDGQYFVTLREEAKP